MPRKGTTTCQGQSHVRQDQDAHMCTATWSQVCCSSPRSSLLTFQWKLGFPTVTCTAKAQHHSWIPVYRNISIFNTWLFISLWTLFDTVVWELRKEAWDDHNVSLISWSRLLKMSRLILRHQFLLAQKSSCMDLPALNVICQHMSRDICISIKLQLCWNTQPLNLYLISFISYSALLYALFSCQPSLFGTFQHLYFSLEFFSLMCLLFLL